MTKHLSIRGVSNPSLRPQTVTESSWYYENRGGIDVYIKAGDETANVRIQWARLMKSAKRCGKETK